MKKLTKIPKKVITGLKDEYDIYKDEITNYKILTVFKNAAEYDSRYVVYVFVKFYDGDVKILKEELDADGYHTDSPFEIDVKELNYLRELNTKALEVLFG